MNYRGSYRKLLGNAKSAMMAAIEIYNKPAFQYRDECVVILLLNAWELLLKAVLSKNGRSIYYRKRRGQPYRTLSWQDAFTVAAALFPAKVEADPVRRNLGLLGTYRDNAVHFYNAHDFGLVIYSLSQTAITNFRDLMEAVFKVRLEDDVNLRLLPLGLRPPIDPIEYISVKANGTKAKSQAVRQFLTELSKAVAEIEDAGGDTGRVLTVFNVKLESVKKIEKADVLVGVAPADEGEGPLAIVRPSDPNVTHPLRQKEIVQSIEELAGQKFTPYVFQAVAWKYDLKSQSQYCWKAKEGILTRYSNDIIPWLKRLSRAEIDGALKDYKAFLRSKRKPVEKVKARA